MASDSFNQILTEIAKKNNTSPEHVRSEMQKAMDAAMRNPDPAIQARWASIPRKVTTWPILTASVPAITSTNRKEGRRKGSWEGHGQQSPWHFIG